MAGRAALRDQVQRRRPASLPCCQRSGAHDEPTKYERVMFDLRHLKNQDGASLDRSELGVRMR